MSTFPEVLEALRGRWKNDITPDLDRIRALLDVLGDPQRAYPAIHLTGTNGKTSTARMVDAVLRAHALRTGRTTSPDLESITERIALDGQPLSQDAFAAVYDEVVPLAELVDARVGRVTYFELLTAMAFASFADAPVDVAVIEVGLGGRWDATNVIDAMVTVVTPISLDHTRLLGDSVADIAAEKAGIIHPLSVAVLGQQVEAAAEVLTARAAEVGAGVLREGIDFGVLDRRLAVGGQQLVLRTPGATYGDVFLPLLGAHQAHNAACALAAVQAFLGSPLEPDLVREGFAMADSPGRLEIVRRGPTVLLDGAHNPAGARALAATLDTELAFRHVVAVLSVLDDKDAAGIIEALEPVIDVMVCTESGSSRALPADDLAAVAADVLGGDRVIAAPRLADAIEEAMRALDDLALAGEGPGESAAVVITGSLTTVGSARTLLRRRG